MVRVLRSTETSISPQARFELGPRRISLPPQVPRASSKDHCASLRVSASKSSLRSLSEDCAIMAASLMKVPSMVAWPRVKTDLCVRALTEMPESAV